MLRMPEPNIVKQIRCSGAMFHAPNWDATNEKCQPQYKGRPQKRNSFPSAHTNWRDGQSSPRVEE